MQAFENLHVLMLGGGVVLGLFPVSKNSENSLRNIDDFGRKTRQD